MGITCSNHLMVITNCFFVTVFHEDIGKSREKKSGDPLKHRSILCIFCVLSVSIETTIFNGNEIQQCIARASWIFSLTMLRYYLLSKTKIGFSIVFAVFFFVPFDSKSLKQFSWNFQLFNRKKRTGSIQAFVVLTTALGNLF